MDRLRPCRPGSGEDRAGRRGPSKTGLTVPTGQRPAAQAQGRAVNDGLVAAVTLLLSSPRFVRFWIEETRRHKGNVKFAILEDAEDLLLPRDCGNGDKVANLLNVADGFLGDHLKLHVVATTNVPINKLDPAIVRPGRLIGAREFRRLTRAEAERLAAAKGLALPDKEDFSLAEVYAGDLSAWPSGKERKIGFA